MPDTASGRLWMSKVRKLNVTICFEETKLIYFIVNIYFKIYCDIFSNLFGKKRNKLNKKCNLFEKDKAKCTQCAGHLTPPNHAFLLNKLDVWPF